jgi:3-methyladenine DNA glycosylase/8-oxoguanine DNA glycosylase
MHSRRSAIRVASREAATGSLPVRVRGPFDLPLSLAAAASFLPVTQSPSVLTTAIEWDANAVVVTISQPARRTSVVHASAIPPIDKRSLAQIAKWLVWSELDLRPFYELAAPHPTMNAVVSSLNGVKPLRPATLFEMAIIAITEQQLSLAAAFHIRARLVSCFGERLGNLWRFPSAKSLAAASVRELSSCGLYRRKAEYVKELAEQVRQGTLDFNSLKEKSDNRIRQELLAARGFGEWSVEYILARGFGRADALPSGDVSLRRVVGHYFGRGRRLTPTQLERALASFKPFRGLAAYYVAVHWRLRRSANRTCA